MNVLGVSLSEEFKTWGPCRERNGGYDWDDTVKVRIVEK